MIILYTLTDEQLSTMLGDLSCIILTPAIVLGFIMIILCLIVYPNEYIKFKAEEARRDRKKWYPHRDDISWERWLKEADYYLYFNSKYPCDIIVRDRSVDIGFRYERMMTYDEWLAKQSRQKLMSIRKAENIFFAEYGWL